MQETGSKKETESEVYQVPIELKENYKDSNKTIEIKKDYEPVAKRTRKHKIFWTKFVDSAHDWKTNQIKSVYHSDTIIHNKGSANKLQFHEALQKEYHNCWVYDVYSSLL